MVQFQGLEEGYVASQSTPHKLQIWIFRVLGEYLRSFIFQQHYCLVPIALFFQILASLHQYLSWRVLSVLVSQACGNKWLSSTYVWQNTHISIALLQQVIWECGMGQSAIPLWLVWWQSTDDPDSVGVISATSRSFIHSFIHWKEFINSFIDRHYTWY